MILTKYTNLGRHENQRHGRMDLICNHISFQVWKFELEIILQNRSGGQLMIFKLGFRFNKDLPYAEIGSVLLSS